MQVDFLVRIVRHGTGDDTKDKDSGPHDSKAHIVNPKILKMSDCAFLKYERIKKEDVETKMSPIASVVVMVAESTQSARVR